MVALASLSPGPPRPCPSPATPRRRPPPLTPHLRTSSRRGQILRAATATAATPGADDYHSTIRSLNSRGRHVPRKSLGQVHPLTPESALPTHGLTIHHGTDAAVFSPQNYMLNSKVNEELVAAAGVEEGDVVLEIGPGTGSLTAALLQAGATVFAVEKVRNVCFAWCSVAGLCADCYLLAAESVRESS